MIINYKNSGDVLHAPYRKYPKDAGYDLCANESILIEGSSHATVSTGLSINIPDGYCGMVLSRSGLASLRGLFVLNAPGIIDAGYSGEVKVVLGNMSWNSFQVVEGMRICQFMLVRVEDYTFLPGMVWEGDRGTNGFGSTGD